MAARAGEYITLPRLRGSRPGFGIGAVAVSKPFRATIVRAGVWVWDRYRCGDRFARPTVHRDPVSWAKYRIYRKSPRKFTPRFYKCTSCGRGPFVPYTFVTKTRDT